MRSTRWYAHELERRDRHHAAQLDAERAAWRDERARLVETVCMLAGRPLYHETPADDVGDGEEPDVDLDAMNEPPYPTHFGDGLLTYQPDEEG